MGRFYRYAWPIIKWGIICAFHALSSIDYQSFYHLVDDEIPST
jgi:hypothetical protein